MVAGEVAEEKNLRKKKDMERQSAGNSRVKKRSWKRRERVLVSFFIKKG